MTEPTRTTKPTLMTEEHRIFLNELRESGETNMFGASPFLQDEFGFEPKDARLVLSEWMASFKEDSDGNL